MRKQAQVHTDRYDQTKNMNEKWTVTSHTPILEHIKQIDEEKA